MLPCMLSFYVGLIATNLRTNQQQYSLRIWGKLRIASLSLNFTGSYEKSVQSGMINLMKEVVTCSETMPSLKFLLPKHIGNLDYPWHPIHLSSNKRFSHIKHFIFLVSIRPSQG